MLVVGGLAGVLSTLALLTYFQVSSEVAAGVTKDGLLRVRPGMNEQDVVRAIGRPLWQHRYYGPGLGTQWVDEPNESVWQYAHAGFLGTGFSVYVLFKQNQVSGTDIKYNDFTVYACTTWKCPQLLPGNELMDALPARSQ